MNTNKKGFTLIELLVVIVIIGILATISVATFGGYFKKARDSERQSAVQNIATIMKVINATNETVDYHGIDKNNDGDYADTGETEITTKATLDTVLSAQGYTTPDSKNGFKYRYAVDADKDDFFIAVCSEEKAGDGVDEVFSAGTPVGVSMVVDTNCDDSSAATDPNTPTVNTTAVTGWNATSAPTPVTW